MYLLQAGILNANLRHKYSKTPNFKFKSQRNVLQLAFK